jgi:putative SOS response-associated peptidase YedK
MCGRYSLATPDPTQLRARFGLEQSVEIRRRYNVAPGDEVLALTTDRDGRPRGEHLRWGLVPSWAESPAVGLKMINARVETVAERPAYRAAFERFRCLILADGFYEWRAAEPAPTAVRRPRQPFHITRADHRPFAFAGLWSSWRAPDGERLRTCTIITTTANPRVAPLHDRMPVILDPQAERLWLDAATPLGQLPELLQGLSADETDLRPVSTAVNDARYDGPECLADPEPAAQAALF